MQESLLQELNELLCAFRGLKVIETNDDNVLIRGLVSFEADYQNMEMFSDCFELEVLIPRLYPQNLPVVKEVGGQIRKDYEHINIDDSFCLAVPLEKKIVFEDCPTLLGFMDNLVIPFLYCYCFWNKYSVMPYGEMFHGTKGLAQYYLNLFDSKIPAHTFTTIINCLRSGYNAHVPCACGSGRKTLRCHKNETKLISKAANKEQVIRDLMHIQNAL